RLPKGCAVPLADLEVSRFEIVEAQQNYGLRSKDSHILDADKWVMLREAILAMCTSYGYEVMGYDYTEYKITQSWITYKKPGSGHGAHFHPNSLISGVLFLGEYVGGMPPIMFHKESSSSFNYLL